MKTLIGIRVNIHSIFDEHFVSISNALENLLGKPECTVCAVEKSPFERNQTYKLLLDNKVIATMKKKNPQTVWFQNYVVVWVCPYVLWLLEG